MTLKDFQFVAPSVFLLNAYQEREGIVRGTETQEWILRPEAYFGYLQFIEFQHAIESSKRAYWLSVAAIVIAIISAMLALQALD